MSDQLPKGWVRASLREVGTWRGGGTPSKAREEFWVGGRIPWVSPKDMKSYEIYDSEDHISEAAVDSSPAKVLPPDSVLIVVRSGILEHTLPVARARVPVTVNQDVKGVTPSGGIDAGYLTLACRAAATDILKSCSKSGTTVASIEMPALLDFGVPLAPEREQRRIVDEVEKQFTRLDAAVVALKRVKANLKRYRASVLKAACEGRLVPTEAEVARREGRTFESGEELLKRILKERRARWEVSQLARMKAAGKAPRDDTWRRRYEEPGADPEPAGNRLPEGWHAATLAQLAWTSGYGTSTRCDYGALGPPVLRIPNVEKARIDLRDLKFAIDKAAVAGEDPLERGDFLVVRTNGSRALIGRGAIIREGFSSPHHFASYLIRFRVVTDTLSKGWLSIVWQTPWIRSELEGKAATSAGQYNLSLTSLSPTRVPLPPLAEQHRIVAEVERRLSVVDELEATVEKNLARCTRLRQSILKMAFEGRLVPQDPNDVPASVLLERIRTARSASAGAPSGRAPGNPPGRNMSKRS